MTNEEIEEALRMQNEAIQILTQRTQVLRDKLDAVTKMVGDLQDHPKGSLRQRMTWLESHQTGMDFKHTIREQFTLKEDQEPKQPLRRPADPELAD